MRRSRLLATLASLLVALSLFLAGMAPAFAASLVPSVEVQAYQGAVGLRAPVSDGGTSGGDGVGKALQTLRLTLDGVDVPGDLSYQVCQNGLWSREATSGQTLGTRGTSIQAVRMALTGEAADHFELVYRASVVGSHWLGWASASQDAGAPGFAAIDAVQVRLLPKGAALPESEGSPTLGPAGLAYSGDLADGGWQGPVTSGSVGTAGVSLLDFKGELTGSQRPSGSIRYSVFTNGAWTPEASDGRDACAADPAHPIEGLRVSLSGEVASFYDVWYRVFVRDRGWLGCTSNGAAAGSANSGYVAEAVQLWLRPKGSAAPTSTDTPFIERFRSGDPELDGIVDTVLDNVTGRDGAASLRRAYDYVASYSYRYMDTYPTGDWSPYFAKQMYWNYGGNCYRYASLFRELARGLGYRARVVSGAVPTRSNPEAPHGWCEIELDGTLYIFDPDMQHEYPSRNFYQRTYDQPPINYIIYERGPW